MSISSKFAEKSSLLLIMMVSISTSSLKFITTYSEIDVGSSSDSTCVCEQSGRIKYVSSFASKIAPLLRIPDVAFTTVAPDFELAKFFLLLSELSIFFVDSFYN